LAKKSTTYPVSEIAVLVSSEGKIEAERGERRSRAEQGSGVVAAKSRSGGVLEVIF
jgi:hypothetical protein